MVPFESLGTVAILFAFRSNYRSVLYHFPDKARYWTYIGRNGDFSYSLHSTPPLRGSPSVYCHTVRYQKTKMAWLSDGGKSLNFDDMFSRFRQTSCDSIVRAMHSIAR